MFLNPKAQKKAIRSLIFIGIIIIGITAINCRNKSLENTEILLIGDINVFVREKPLNGLNEHLLCEDYCIQMICEQIIDDLDNRLSFSHFHLNEKNPDNTKIIDAWCQNYRKKNFIVIKQKYREIINVTSIIGIQDATLIQITGYSMANNVPYTCGPCARRMRDIFGFSLKKVTTSTANTRS
jgi:hypothetical protein